MRCLNSLVALTTIDLQLWSIERLFDHCCISKLNNQHWITEKTPLSVPLCFLHTVWFKDLLNHFIMHFLPGQVGWCISNLFGLVHNCQLLNYFSHYNLIAAPCHENEWEKWKAVLICRQKSYRENKRTWSIPSNGWHKQETHNVLIYGSLHCWQGLDRSHVAKQRYHSSHGFGSRCHQLSSMAQYEN